MDGSEPNLTDGWRVRARKNGAAWFQAHNQVLSASGATDASSSDWGECHEGPGPDQVLMEAATDFPDESVDY